MTDKQEEKKPAYMTNLPYFMHEEILAREERTARRLAILCGIAFAALVISNIAWMTVYFR